MRTVFYKPRRVILLDELRGLSIILMVVYHTAYDLVAIFSIPIPFFSSPIMKVLQSVFAGVFIVISGIATQYSHNNFKRGFIALGVGVLMSLVTMFVIPEQIILFGILHFLGTAMIICAIIMPIIDKINPFIGFITSVILFILTIGVPNGYVGIPNVLEISLPDSLYKTFYLFPLGFTKEGFYSSDFFPIFPWVFLFIAGSFLGFYFKSDSFPAFFYKSHIRMLAVVSKYSLIIYVLHQPIIYGILMLIFRVIG